MPAMDIADVAYDRFLANGRPEIQLYAEPGETVRLRVIDGSATTYFRLQFSGGPMTIVAADGQDTEPFQENHFLIAVAETYDVLLHVPGHGAYEFRATAHDGSAFASVWIGTGKRHPAAEIPKPNLYHTMGVVRADKVFALSPAGSMGMSDKKVHAGEFDLPGMMGMPSKGTDHGHPGAQEEDQTKDHPMQTHEMIHPSEEEEAPEGHVMPLPAEDPARTHQEMGDSQEEGRADSDSNGKKYSRDFRPLASDVSASQQLTVDGMDPRRPWPPYAKLRSRKPTVFETDKPIRNIRLTLDGDMERYVWFLNNKPLSEADSILIRAGEVVRFIMINRTMMHHPMHLHGHFFRVINGQGAYSPLKHTVNVAPMSTTVIEFDANEFGDWFFHCHLLYHMKSGMARVIHYEDFTLDADLAVVRPRLYKDPWYFWGEAAVLTQMTEGFIRASNTRHILNAFWQVGWGKVDETEWEGIFTWDRYINRFFSIFAGANLEGVRSDIDSKRAVLGIRYLLPFSLESSLWLDSDGGGRIHLDKHFPITPRLSLYGDVHYDTHDAWEGRVGLSYLINRAVSLGLQWHSDYSMGGGIQVRF
jgi:FtsP/CotA-like multicopper oxidase with cupredoxin domain